MILGIDPGLARTGWAVMEKIEGKSARLFNSGLIETLAAAPLPERLENVHRELTDILARYSPAEAAVEELFFLKAAPSVRGTLEARGVILLAVAQARVPIYPYNPRTIKMALTGNGGAAKPQIQRFLQKTLGLESILKPDDVADAAAIALCHLTVRRSAGVKVLEKVGGAR